MGEIWYYEYAIKYYDDIDNKEEIYYGVVPAESMTEAVEHLEGYYGKNILDIQTLKPITDSIVFEFKLAMEDSNFDFTINRK